MKKINLLLLFYTSLSITFGQSDKDWDKNYISHSDPKLERTEKFNNPYRACYNVAASVGADGSSKAGAVYFDVAGFFSLKGFLVRANISTDLTKSNIVSSAHPLGKNGQAYRDIQISGFFNLKEKTTEIDMKPFVGKKVLSVTGNTEKSIYYRTNENVKIRNSFGVGGSIKFNKLNLTYSGQAGNQLEFVTFENNIPTPEHFIMPFNSLIIGMGGHVSKFTSYNFKYVYDGLPQWQLKETFFKILQYEFLFAPSISNEKTILTQTNNLTSSLNVPNNRKLIFSLSQNLFHASID